MAAYGNTIDETISLTTAGAEILNGNVGKVAKGLRSIGANITKLASSADTFQISVNGTMKTIQLVDKETGDMLSTYEVLKQISQYWDEMNSSEQSNLALTLANKTQFEVFTSVLSNFGTAEEALTTSLTSQGSAWKENEAYLEGNEAAINSIKSSLQELILKTPLDELVKDILQLTASLLKLANSGFGQFTIKVGLAYAAIKLFEKKTVTAMVAEYGLEGATFSLGGAFDYYKTKLQESSVATAMASLKTRDLSAALTALNLNPAVAGLTALVAVLSALFIIDGKLQERYENIDSEISELNSEVEQSTDIIKELKEQLGELNDKKLNITDPDQLTQLEAQTAELENQLRLKTELIEADKDRIKSDYEEKISGFGNIGRHEYTMYSAGQMTPWGEYTDFNFSAKASTMDEQLFYQNVNVQSLAKNLETLIEEKEKLNVTEAQYQQYLEKGTGLDKETAEDYENLNQKISVMSSQLNLAKGDFAETVSFMKQAKEAGVELSDNTEAIIDHYDDEIAAVEDATLSLDEIAEKYGVTVEAILEYKEANEDCATYSEAAIMVMAEQAEQAEEISSALSNLSSDIKSLGTDYKALQDAVEDYNNGGKMSLETLDALINAATNYSGCLEIVDGKLVISEGYFEALAQQKIANAKADLLVTTQDRLLAVANDEVTSSVQTASGAIDASKASVNDICVSLHNMSGEAITAAQAWHVLAKEVGGANIYSKNADAYNAIYDEFNAQWKALDDLGKSVTADLGSYAKSSGKSSGSAAKSTKDAWLEAYKAEKDAIDSMYKTGVINAEEYAAKLKELSEKYLTDTEEHQKKYAEQIHSLYEEMYKALQQAAKDSLDEMKDAHKKQEDALKKSNESQEKSIKRQIELLKRQKDAVKDSYDAQIEALKREREEYENQIKLMKLKEELAKAQQQYQYVMDESGKFNWVQDQNAVDEAQEELYEEQLKQAYERQLQDLEDARDAAVQLYEQQIQDLEDYYDKVKEANDEAEDALKEHNDEIEKLYEKAIEDYDTYAEMLANGQLDQIANENSNWATRLNNLANFVNEYNAMLSHLGNEGDTVNSSGGSKFGSGSSYSGGGSKNGSGNASGGVSAAGSAVGAASAAISRARAKNATSGVVQGAQLGAVGANAARGITSSKTLSHDKDIYGSLKRASGDYSIGQDGLYLVGDSPNQELVVGSKLNGVPLTLSKGSGVVNAKSTKTLAGLLNSLPSLPPNYNTTNNTNQQSIHIDNITLPQVSNGKEFIDYLQSFDTDMVQLSF